MKRFAVDVVILPPQEIVEKSVSVNRLLVKKFGKKIVLGKNCLPHVSLLMGCLKRKDLPEARKILRLISRKYLPLKLEISGIQVRPRKDLPTVVFSIRKNRRLQSLHEQAMHSFNKLLSHNPGQEMFYSQPVSPRTLDLVRNYAKGHAFKKFKPHITLGKGGAVKAKIKFPIKFVATKLAVCQLGNSCTCRKVLA